MKVLHAASAVLAVLTFLPFIDAIPFYVNVIATASVVVFVGCHMSLDHGAKTGADGKVVVEGKETMTSKDAMRFPIVGGCVLTGLYVAFKFLSKEWINYIMTAYFVLLGILSVASVMEACLDKFVSAPLKKVLFKIDWKIPVLDEVKFDASPLSMVCLLISGCLGLWYGQTKFWLSNNIFGIAFSIKGIEMLSLGSAKTGFILLIGLFFYDIFFVFGTDIMVTVAKSFDAPIKLVFPRDMTATPPAFSMLGLGDIVIPGIFIALLLRYDRHRCVLKKMPFTATYFTVNWLGYVAGLVTTVFVMVYFQSAQPALLYLVPAAVLGALATAVVLGDLKGLLKYEETGVEVQADKKEATTKSD